MSGERTLDASLVSDAIRRPSFELQEAAIKAGYASVRDYVLAEAVEEIRMLKGRVEALENVTVRVRPSVLSYPETDGTTSA